MRQIILASESQRRIDLLKMLGLKFKVVVSNFKEIIISGIDPHKLTQSFSLKKAQKVSKKYNNAIIIGADTIVYCNKEIMGKACTKKDVRIMLKKLSAKKHSVITALTVIDTASKKAITRSYEATVYMRKISDSEIESYIQTKEPFGKAGAYAIQGFASIFVEKIEGDYFTIVGLPVFELVRTLKELGITFFK